MTCNARNIDNLVQSVLFKEVWSKADATQQERALSLIKNCNKAELTTWMYMHESLEFGDKPWRALIEHAKLAQIKNYSRLTKLELLQQLEEVKRRNNAKTCKETGTESVSSAGQSCSSS